MNEELSLHFGELLLIVVLRHMDSVAAWCIDLFRFVHTSLCWNLANIHGVISEFAMIQAELLGVDLKQDEGNNRYIVLTVVYFY